MKNTDKDYKKQISLKKCQFSTQKKDFEYLRLYEPTRNLKLRVEFVA
ncbi:MAG: hypothetical protein U5M51_00205 [Emticicia sp.]|nr:hypothetical protein [Emticicia sp.]